jgi:hypothetical protein
MGTVQLGAARALFCGAARPRSVSWLAHMTSFSYRVGPGIPPMSAPGVASRRSCRYTCCVGLHGPGGECAVQQC